MSKVSCVKLFISVYIHRHFDDLLFMFLVITIEHTLEHGTVPFQKEKEKVPALQKMPEFFSSNSQMYLNSV
jgi:hypothetical protein